MSLALKLAMLSRCAEWNKCWTVTKLGTFSIFVETICVDFVNSNEILAMAEKYVYVEITYETGTVDLETNVYDANREWLES